MDERERKIYALQAQLCQVLADPSRLELIHLIGTGERTVGELIAATGLRQATVSYRLAYPEILEACALTRRILVRQLEAARELVAPTAEG